ncbi:MAG: 50S ribosomal protein L11 methyltransferase [Halobacteriovoraceae bacterium]|nr:50S ribosomal protein L11 methyltransferase [Halobacteriovoraceae bacterium]
MNKVYNILKCSLDGLEIQEIELLKIKAMHDFHCSGVEEYSIDEQKVDEILGERAYSGGDIPLELYDEIDLSQGPNEMFFYFENSNVENFKKYLLSENISNVTIDQKNFEDWNSIWKKHYERISISKRIEIVPSWEKTQNKSNEIYIYPGQGFGTGGHETTFLCLKLFDSLLNNNMLKPGFKCLDFGCGSGILGIAALKWQSMGVVFCDIDPNALDNTVQNIELNFEGHDLSGSSVVLRERLEVNKKYDLIFANILENILDLEKDLIYSLLNTDGYLIVSGLLNEQVESLKDKYIKLGLKSVENVSKGNWSALLFKKI